MSKILKKKHKCPICGEYDFPYSGSFDVCPHCGWEDDPVQLDDPDFDVGANEFSLNEYKAKYQRGWRPDWINEEP